MSEKKERLKHDYNQPFHGIPSEKFKQFNAPKYSVKEASEMTNQQLGIAIREYDCPNCFGVFSTRLWKECKNQGKSILKDEDRAYEVFQDELFVTLRRNISSWNDEKKSGQFFGWAKTVMYRGFLCALRHVNYKNDNMHTNSLQNIGNFTSLSEIEYKNGMYDIMDDENDIHAINEKKDEKLYAALSSLKEEDKKVFEFVALNNVTMKQAAQELGMDLNTLNKIYSRVRRNLRTMLS